MNQGTMDKSRSTKHSFERKSGGLRSQPKNCRGRGSRFLGVTQTNAFPHISGRKKDQHKLAHKHHNSLSGSGIESAGSVVSEEQNELDLAPKYFDMGLRSASQAQMLVMSNSGEKGKKPRVGLSKKFSMKKLSTDHSKSMLGVTMNNLSTSTPQAAYCAKDFSVKTQ